MSPARRAARTLTRLPPQLPAHAMTTYRVATPLPTHWRQATCAEVDCPHHVHGWKTTVAADGEAALYIRSGQSGRHYSEDPDAPPGLATFVFPPGQQCFRPHEHRVRTGRPERLLVVGGDWRGNPRQVPVREHASPEAWRDDFAEHQQTLVDRLAAG